MYGSRLQMDKLIIDLLLSHNVIASSDPLLPLRIATLWWNAGAPTRDARGLFLFLSSKLLRHPVLSRFCSYMRCRLLDPLVLPGASHHFSCCSSSSVDGANETSQSLLCVEKRVLGQAWLVSASLLSWRAFGKPVIVLMLVPCFWLQL